MCCFGHCACAWTWQCGLELIQVGWTQHICMQVLLGIVKIENISGIFSSRWQPCYTFENLNKGQTTIVVILWSVCSLFYLNTNSYKLRNSRFLQEHIAFHYHNSSFTVFCFSYPNRQYELNVEPLPFASNAYLHQINMQQASKQAAWN